MKSKFTYRYLSLAILIFSGLATIVSAATTTVMYKFSDQVEAKNACNSALSADPYAMSGLNRVCKTNGFNQGNGIFQLYYYVATSYDYRQHISPTELGWKRENSTYSKGGYIQECERLEELMITHSHSFRNLECISYGFCYGENCEASKQYCPPNHTLNPITNQCEARCSLGATWDESTQLCVSPPVAQSCQTQGPHPIDFTRGHKYRTEPVISTGGQYPISLMFYYNNQGNAERTTGGPIVLPREGNNPGGEGGTGGEGGNPASVFDPMTESQYLAQYPNASSEAQRFASIQRYWRHNYEHALLPKGDGTWSWERPKGEAVTLSLSGQASAVYPAIQFQALSASEQAELGFSGHRIIANNQRYWFDELGRLRRKAPVGQSLYHELEYQGDSLAASRIRHSLGGYLDLTYTTKTTDNRYIIGTTQGQYLDTVVDSSGRQAQVQWSGPISGASRQHYLVSQITYPYIGTAEQGRAFIYGEANFPIALTQIDDLDLAANQQKVYATFSYDDQGRAIQSQLAGGADAISVAYPDDNTRVVTNALGKQASYRFEEFNGIKRLAQVTGEPTANCLQSEVRYEYDSAGNLSAKEQNNQRTTYQYNARGLETQRVEAAGTPEARTIETQWHPEFNLPVRIIEPSRETVFDYDAVGRLIQQRTLGR